MGQRTIRDRLAEHDLVLLVLGLFGVLSILTLGSQMGQDGWLAVLVGRLISHSGLPSHDTLTVMTLGHRWVDQQWLGQWLMYRLADLGGIRLLALFHVVVVVGTVAAGAMIAIRRGGRRGMTALVIGVAFEPMWVCMTHIRTQTLVYPLFLAVLVLVTADVRRPSSRVFWTLPLLILWTNVHGTVLLGVGMVGLRGLWIARSEPRRAAALIGVALAGLVASPYIAHLPSYYKDTAFNSHFGGIVAEWAPTAPSGLSAAFYLLIVGVVATVARAKTERFDVVVLAVLAVNGMLAVRSMVWFALAALVLLPPMLASISFRPRRQRRQREEAPVAFRAGIGGAGIAATACALLVVALKPAQYFERDYPRADLARVAQVAARYPGRTIYSDERFADWLMYKDPGLQGHLAYDIRFELLSDYQLGSVVRFKAEEGDAWRRPASRAPIVLIGGTEDPKPDHVVPLYAALQRGSAPRRLVFRSKHMTLLTSRGGDVGQR